MRRNLIILLAVLAAFLSCAIVVVASSRGRSKAEAALAQVASDEKSLEEARRATAERVATLEQANADLKKQLDRAKAELAEQASKQSTADKLALQLRGDLDAEVKQVADLSRKFADARDAERKAQLEADAAKKDAATRVVKNPAADVVAVHDGNNKNVNKNGKKRGSVALLPRTTPSFSEMDKTQRGRISLEEFKAGFPSLEDPESKFKSLDTNNDGFLSLDEYKAGYPDPALVHTKRVKKR